MALDNSARTPTSDQSAAPVCSPRRRNVVLVLGVSCQDTVLTVEKFPERDSKSLVESRRVFGGGNGGNVAVGLARLVGAKPSEPDGSWRRRCEAVSVQLATTLCADPAGLALRAEFEREGVGLDHAFCPEVFREEVPCPFGQEDGLLPARSATSFVILDRQTQSRTILHERQRPNVYVVPQTTILEDLFANDSPVQCVFTDSRFPAAVTRITERAFASNVPIFMDCERIRNAAERAFMEQMLGHCRVVTCCEGFLPQLFPGGVDGGGKVPAALSGPNEVSLGQYMVRLLETYPALDACVVTRGERGCLWLERVVRAAGEGPSPAADGQLRGGTVAAVLPELTKDSVAAASPRSERGNAAAEGTLSFVSPPSSEAVLLPVVDTTGAGDAFAAAITYVLGVLGLGVEEACEFAAAAAGCSVTRLGARSGMPRLIRGGRSSVPLKARLRLLSEDSGDERGVR